MTPNEIKELEIQKNIINHVDSFKSFRFNAGAGAGKTYALIETLKYVTIHKITATKSPQKVACITYTNVAVREIKNRLGNSETVQVSTIHEYLWEIIKKAQPQLLICHKEKVKQTIDSYNQELYNSDEAKFFFNLDKTQQQYFFQYAMQTKDIFYQSKNFSAASFKSFYLNNNEIHKPLFIISCLKNVKNFKYVVELFYKIQRLEECLKNIDSKEEKRVYYDSKVNTDRLHYMKFSHNTLLEYGLKLVKNYPTLCRIIVDSYPYFFIDEYQDTHCNVVKFVKTVHDYAIKNNKNWMVGYFGDTAQSIYEDGVGRRITELHDGLDDIDNLFNRRSHQQIINIANNIRADKIVQIPIFEERNNGSTIFFHHNSEDKLTIAQKFLADYKNDLIKANKTEGDTDSDNNKIHCLVLTNRLMARFNGFSDVYQTYQKSTIYHDNLNTQVLSQQLEKLHPTILTIYHFVRLYQDIQMNIVSYYDIFGTYSKKITFSKASLVIRELQNTEVASLKDWVELITQRFKNSEAKEEIGKLLINRIKYEKDKVTSSDVLMSTFLDSINTLMNRDSEDENMAKEKINSVLELPITSLTNWANFIRGIEYGDIIYHTYHGAKGEEYENVAIILEHSFGSKDRGKFKSYFNAIQKKPEGEDHILSAHHVEENHINAQNLLYVACSRAIINLRILYLDDISEIKEGIESIFGKSTLLSIGETHIPVGFVE